MQKLKHNLTWRQKTGDLLTKSFSPRALNARMAGGPTKWAPKLTSLSKMWPGSFCDETSDTPCENNLPLSIFTAQQLTREILMDKYCGDLLFLPNQSRPILAGQHWNLPTKFYNTGDDFLPGILCKCQESWCPRQDPCPAHIAASAEPPCSPPHPSWLSTAISETADTTWRIFLSWRCQQKWYLPTLNLEERPVICSHKN